jgi:hypothetical protein
MTNLTEIEALKQNQIDLLIEILIKISITILTIVFNSTIIISFLIIIKNGKPYFGVTFTLFLIISISDLFNGLFGMTSQFVLDFTNKLMIKFEKFFCIFSIFIQYSMVDLTILVLLAVSFQRYFQLSLSANLSEKLSIRANKVKILVASLLSPVIWILLIIYYHAKNQIDFELCLIKHSFIFSLIKEIFISIMPIIMIVYLNTKSMLMLKNKKRKFSKFLLLKNNDKKSRQRRITINNKNENITFISYLIIKIKSKNPTQQIMNQNQLKPSSTCLTQLNSCVSTSAASTNKRDKRLLMFMICVTINIFLTQLIYLVTWPLFIINPYLDLLNNLYHYGVWISYSHSLTNPILFILFNETIKSQLKRLFI